LNLRCDKHKINANVHVSVRGHATTPVTKAAQRAQKIQTMEDGYIPCGIQAPKSHLLAHARSQDKLINSLRQIQRKVVPQTPYTWL
jgi:hypothetical protein